ncbi:C1 family peptidase [Mesorhizobium sp.]|uniref:C1 family peptidase n=1 Tax=Mesorhizobium sp. TaxID=1871066 RepID=UPI000FE684C6|nr:C1 family peptidase [Mesorhizobium sp.]RWD81316.1 MAG: hypothetical protein EOS48_16655 [Mesorhizobium sp.]
MTWRAILIAVGLAVAPAVPKEVYAQAPGNDQRFFTGLKPVAPKTFRSFPFTPTHRAFIPDQVDLSTSMPAVGNQGEQPSCVAWAVGYAARSYYASETEHRDISKKSHIVSPAYIYNTITDDNSNCSEGTYISDALDLLKAGAVSWKDFPYKERSCRRPPEDLRGKATDFKVKKWLAIEFTNLDQIKAELATGHPVIVGIANRKAFENFRGKKPFTGSSEAVNGYHALTLTGFDEGKQVFRGINSWGRDWGDRGYFWYSYSALSQDIQEAYVMRVGEDPVAPVEPQPAPEPNYPPPSPEPNPEIVAELPSPACSSIRVDKEGGKTVLRGFVGYPQDLDAIREFATKTDMANEVELYAWPQCEVLLTLESAQGSLPPSIAGSKKRDLNEGDALVIELSTPPVDSYLHLAYIQADGSVVHLAGSDRGLTQYRPKSALKWGDGSNGSPFLKVAPPFGREMLVAISSKSPLFDEERPSVETEREFLTALRRAVLFGRNGEQPGRSISATFQLLETHSAKSNDCVDGRRQLCPRGVEK